MSGNSRLSTPSVLRFFFITDVTFLALIQVRRRVHAAINVLLLLTLGWAPLSHADGANVMVDSGGVSATATVNASSMTLRVGGPSGFADEVRSNGGYVSWSLPGPLLDGTYHYDVYTTVGSRTALDADSDRNDVVLYRQSGSFDVLGGTIVPSLGGQQGAATDVMSQERSWLARLGTALLDLVFPAATAADLTASSTAPKVDFDDTQVGLPATPEWRLEGLEAYVNQEEDFRLTDILNSGTVLEVRPSANTNLTFTVDLNGDIHLANDAVFVDRSTQSLGVGTTTPTAPLHIVDSSPSILLDDGVQSFPISVPDDFLITHNNGTNTIEVMSVENNGAQRGWVSFGRGQIGFPGAPLEIFRADGTAKVFAQDTLVPGNPGVPQTMFELRRPGAVRFDLVDESNGTTWVFQNRLDAFDITKAGTGVQEFKVDGSGNLTVLGNATAAAFLTSSDRNLKENFVDLEGGQVLAKLTALPVTEWSFKGDPVRHIGPTAQDFKAAFGLGPDETHITPLDIASVAVVGVKELHKMIEVRDAEIAEHEAKLAEREAEIAALKQRLAVLEEMVSRIVAQQPTQTAQR